MEGQHLKKDLPYVGGGQRALAQHRRAAVTILILRPNTLVNSSIRATARWLGSRRKAMDVSGAETTRQSWADLRPEGNGRGDLGARKSIRSLDHESQRNPRSPRCSRSGACAFSSGQATWTNSNRNPAKWPIRFLP
ncbi:hypothetical protein KM043_000336 [Ampulex compressa]|nr:hypothetical protein KM043_000336 [Ampulex compressa]